MMIAGKRAGAWFTGVSAVAMAAAAFVLYLNLPVARTTRITGTVRCASGQAVAGVWIQEAQGVGEFASWQPDSSDPALARFSFDLRGHTYAVHVGCGGTSKQWATEVRSDHVPMSTIAFVCHDEPSDGLYETCTPQAG
jgi:hypothetical protein